MILHRLLLLCVAGFLPAAGAAQAGPREDSIAGISRCPAGLDDHAYLDCIYGAVQPLRAALGLPPAPAAQQRLVPQPQAGPSGPPVAASGPSPRSGGFLGRMLGADTADLHMTAYSFDKRGFMTVTLSNGEVWQQDANDTNFARLGSRASDYVIALTAGDFGEAKMDVRGEPGTFTMRRIR